MPPHVVSRLNELASREGRTKNNAEGVQRYEAASRGENTLPSFEEVLGGESEDPILSMNLTPPDYAETVQPEVESEPTPATLGDANKGNEYHNPEERENTGEREEIGGGEESVVAEQVIAPARRTMMDMFRRGGVEMALSTSVLESIERKIGGDLSDYVMNITVKQAMKTRGEDAERVIM